MGHAYAVFVTLGFDLVPRVRDRTFEERPQQTAKQLVCHLAARTGALPAVLSAPTR